MQASVLDAAPDAPDHEAVENASPERSKQYQQHSIVDNFHSSIVRCMFHLCMYLHVLQILVIPTKDSSNGDTWEYPLTWPGWENDYALRDYNPELLAGEC